VYLVSGGMREIIQPAAAMLGIPLENVFANRLKYYFSGGCFVSVVSSFFVDFYCPRAGLQSRKESDVFRWSWIFLSDSRSPIGSFLHCTPKLGTPVEMVQFLLKLLLKPGNSCWVPRFPLIASCYKSVDSQTSFTL